MRTKPWYFKCFVSARGVDVIDDWYADISKKGKAKLDRALEHLAVQEKSEWSRPHASPLGNHIYVIRFSDENRTQHRIAGHFHGDSLIFVLSQPGVEKDDQYNPHNIFELAQRHKTHCDGDFTNRTCDCFALAVHELDGG